MAVKDTIDLGKVGIWMGAVGKQAILDAANYLAERAEIHAPIDTGWLRASITVDIAPGQTIARVTVGAFYAQYVEFGHLTSNGGYVPPNPFFMRAMDDTDKAFPKIVDAATALLPYGNTYKDAFGLNAQKDLFMGVSFTAQM